MMDRDEPRKRSARSEELFFTGLKKKPVSDLNAPVWKFTLLASGACLLAWLLKRAVPVSAEKAKILLLALTLIPAWILAVRLLLFEAKAKIFWIIWLAVGFILLLVTGEGSLAWLGPTFFSFAFLLFRKYRPYGHLTSRRQAALFAIGFVLFVLLTFFWTGGEVANPTSAQAALPSGLKESTLRLAADSLTVIRNMAVYGLVSLRWFWFFSLFHLFFTVRLHFMKLRPKLAVAAIFLVVVPIVLLIVLGLGTLYMTLGESHAVRARATLDQWAELAAVDEDFVRVVSPSWFAARSEPGGLKSEGQAPGWLPEFVRSLGASGTPWPAGGPSKAVYFLRGSSLWLLAVSRPGAGTTIVRGCPVDKTILDRLAGVVRGDVRLSTEYSLFREILARERVKEKTAAKPAGLELSIGGAFAPVQPEKAGAPARPPSFWRRPIYFGVTDLEAFALADGAFRPQRLLLQTSRSLLTTGNELFSAANPLSALVLASLISLGAVFLILETLALIFGLRISGGITKAIRALHRHLCCVSEGDLDAVIDIPNEDELGDLAASFNQMTAAIKQGREEAIARERLEKELETARQIQERLLPHKMPIIPGFEVSGISLPSREVGGDYFDFLDLPTGQLGVAIADVSGKGIPAALLMANLQASLRAQEHQPGGVSVIASRLNGLLVQNTDERMFVTFFYGILDKLKATFTYTNAGHNPPLLLRANGRLARLEEGGMLLGFLADQSYVQSTVSLEPEDVLLLFTDGIVEAVNPQAVSREEKYFGEERLLEVLRANAGRSVADIQAAVLSAVAGHTRQSAPGDDMTLVVIKRTGGREALAYVS